MQYMGGKSRIASQIAEVITNTVKGGGQSMRYQGGKSRIARPIAETISRRGGELLCEPVLRQLCRRKQGARLFPNDPQ